MPQIVYRYGLHAPHEGVEIVYAPSVATEGKSWQLRGR